MNILRLPLVLALSSLLCAPILRADAETPAAGRKLYVTIDTFDPMKFDELRYARSESGEIVLSTLKATAAASAKFAGLADEVVVLEENAKAPAGASVLCLTWTDGRRTVTADLTENGKNSYLGVPSRISFLSHPDHKRITRELRSAVMPDASSDAAVRAETEMNLYFALKMTADRRARLAAK